MEAGIARNIQGGFGPTSVTAMILKNVRMTIVKSEKILKNQLLSRVFTSKRATVDMFIKDSISSHLNILGDHSIYFVFHEIHIAMLKIGLNLLT